MVQSSLTSRALQLDQCLQSDVYSGAGAAASWPPGPDLELAQFAQALQFYYAAAEIAPVEREAILLHLFERSKEITLDALPVAGLPAITAAPLAPDRLLFAAAIVVADESAPPGSFTADLRAEFPSLRLADLAHPALMALPPEIRAICREICVDMDTLVALDAHGYLIVDAALLPDPASDAPKV